MKRNLVVVPLENQSAFFFKNSPTFLESLADKGSRIFVLRKRSVGLSNKGRFSGLSQMRRIKNNQGKGFIIEREASEIKSNVRLDFEPSAVNLYVGFVSNIAEKNARSFFVKVKLFGAAARIKNFFICR